MVVLRGGAGMGPRRRWGLVLVVGLALGVWSNAGARVPIRAIEYHATVLNGRVVGSAFLIREGVAVTNSHVLRGRVPGDHVTLVTSAHGRVPARITAISSRMDLAVLDVPGGVMTIVPTGGARVAEGQRVIAAGVDAGGPDWPGEPREASGAVIVVRSDLPAFGPGLILRMPGARPGFSGGPLLDSAGRLLGMVTAIRGGVATGREVSDTEAFALRAADVRAETERLIGRP